MELFSYQKKIEEQSVEILKKSGGVALLMDMGTGKTVTAAAISRIAKRILIVCPTTVASVWANGDINKLIPEAKVTDMTLIDRAKRKGVGDYCIINYNSVWIKQGRSVQPDTWILDWNPDMVICDEAHALADPLSAQSKCMHILSDLVTYRLALTGTPINNSPLDAWSIMRFVDKTVFNAPYIAFEKRYTVSKKLKANGRSFNKVIAFKNLEGLSDKLHSVSFRVTREEVFDLPEETHKFITFPLDASDKLIYDDIANNAKKLLNTGDRDNALVVMVRLRQFLGGFVPVIDKDGQEQLRFGNTEKIKLGIKLARGLYKQGKPFVMFCQFTAEVELLSQYLTEAGIKTELLYGKIKKSERESKVLKFQQGEIDALVCQTKVAGSGLTLTRGVASIFYSVSFSLQELLQAQARIYRKGQEKPVTHYYLVTSNTIEEYVMSKVQSKEKISQSITELRKML